MIDKDRLKALITELLDDYIEYRRRFDISDPPPLETCLPSRYSIKSAGIPPTEDKSE